MPLSAEDLEYLKDRVAKLEMDIDAFSTTLSRLSSSRRLSTSTGDVPAHGVRQGIASNTHELTSRGSTANRPLHLPAVMMVVLTAAAATLTLRRARLKQVRRGREGC